MSTAITIAYGDNQSPAYIDATLHILREAGAMLTLETIEVGSRIYGMDYHKGILPSSFDSLKRTKVLLIGKSQLPEKEGYEQVCDVIRSHFSLSTENLEEEGLEAGDETIRATSYKNEQFALFEAGEEKAASMLLASIMLLEHIEQNTIAARLRTALKDTLRDGINQPTLLMKLLGKAPSEAMLFAGAICSNLGKNPF